MSGFTVHRLLSVAFVRADVTCTKVLINSNDKFKMVRLDQKWNLKFSVLDLTKQEQHRLINYFGCGVWLLFMESTMSYLLIMIY